MPENIGNIFYMNWELEFLHHLQTIHTPELDKKMLFFTGLGDKTILIALFLLALIIIPKTRKYGIQMAIAVVISVLIVNVGIKPFVKRCRPCWLEPNVPLLIPVPHDYSFPSGHTNAFFAMATALYLKDKKLGIPALVLASIVAFSRMYLFAHWPTDVAGGIITGFVSGKISYKLTNPFSGLFKKKKRRRR